MDGVYLNFLEKVYSFCLQLRFSILDQNLNVSKPCGFLLIAKWNSQMAILRDWCSGSGGSRLIYLRCDRDGRTARTVGQGDLRKALL
jgi:hypothetical protein